MDKKTQLAQSRLSGTVAAKIFNIADLTENPGRVVVEHILVTNSTSTDITFSLYHDKDGVTYDESTALYEAATACTYKTKQIDVNIGIENADENIAAKVDLSLGVTFSLYGTLIGV